MSEKHFLEFFSRNPGLPRKQEKGGNQLEKKILEIFHQTPGCHVFFEGENQLNFLKNLISTLNGGFNGFEWAIMAS
jgi:hypothetical protein